MGLHGSTLVVRSVVPVASAVTASVSDTALSIASASPVSQAQVLLHSALPQVLPQVSEAASSSVLTAAPFDSGSMEGRSCLGPELLSQLAGLSLDAAELERNHPPCAPLPTSAQASCHL